MTQLDEAAIFNTARKLDDERREAYLTEVCGGDQTLYQQVAALLRAYDEQPEFLESPPSEVHSPIDTATIREGPGAVIGRYKLLELIGEGGFAVVYMAE